MVRLRRYLRWLWIALACGALHGEVSRAAPDGQSARLSLQQVDYATLSRGTTVIRLTFSAELKERPAVVVTYHPGASVALDFADATSEPRKQAVEVGQRDLRSIQVVSAGERLRVVVTLGRPMPYEIELTGRHLLLTLRHPSAAG